MNGHDPRQLIAFLLFFLIQGFGVDGAPHCQFPYCHLFSDNHWYLDSSIFTVASSTIHHHVESISTYSTTIVIIFIIVTF
jgi:hypothetical protein